ncbi:hypothetical protein DFJ74DRAFT_768989 [Hyaloraphidium curvatum]|nr:hypothetical protein DFJ74DRAFT_768989 [Hyaloraphidium curvatum]
MDPQQYSPGGSGSQADYPLNDAPLSGPPKPTLSTSGPPSGIYDVPTAGLPRAEPYVPPTQHVPASVQGGGRRAHPAWIGADAVAAALVTAGVVVLWVYAAGLMTVLCGLVNIAVAVLIVVTGAIQPYPIRKWALFLLHDTGRGFTWIYLGAFIVPGYAIVLIVFGSLLIIYGVANIGAGFAGVGHSLL